MPTASDFRSTAAALGAIRDELARLLVPLAEEVAAVQLSGPVRPAVETSLGVSSANVRAVIDELDRRVAEAITRSWMCDDYSSAVRDYWRSPDPDRRWPRRPGPWADYG